MNYYDSEYFTYKNNMLYCEDVPVISILEKEGSPTYIYSKKYFIDRYNEFHNAFKEINHIIFYASKCNFNISVIKTFAGQGAGIDVNSGGELYRALKAGVKPEKMLFSGVGKTEEEIQMGLEHDLLLLKAESTDEIMQINKIAGKLGKTARVAIRVNPNVDAKTHPYISTGLSENKFGINARDAVNVFMELSALKNIEFTGIDMHIGSQITTIDPFAEAVDKLAEVFLKLKEKGLKLKHFDIGGGMGVKYHDNNPFAMSELAAAVIPTFKKLDCQVFFEPGRYLTANGAILATKVLNTKMNGQKNFIIVDGAMTDLIRPSFYGAYHHIEPVEIKEDRADIIADIVGPVCESSDFLAKGREISAAKAGDYLAVMSAGAYSMVMASNYNGRRRPAEIMVDGSRYDVVRKRETYEDLVANEILI
jgi:diaminopimelate decarboxylase